MVECLRKRLFGLSLVLVCGVSPLQAFHVPHPQGVRLARASVTARAPFDTRLCAEPDKKEGGGPLSFLFNPYESKIPKEIEKEIYEAEGNTPAAKDRSQRVAIYAAIAFIGILLAFFNGFITELRNSPTPDGIAVSLEDTGFGWVEASFLPRFLFMNKIGGGIMLLTGAGSGLMAEAEFDSRRINAEKIYDEIVRRRTARQDKEDAAAPRKKKKRASTKGKKRMTALSEVISPEKETKAQESKPVVVAKQEETPPEPEKAPTEKEGGIVGSVKDFYQRADNMAASQALLLNKKLEDVGVLEKITDESGLRVVGKQSDEKETGDEASKSTKTES